MKKMSISRVLLNKTIIRIRKVSFHKHFNLAKESVKASNKQSVVLGGRGSVPLTLAFVGYSTLRFYLVAEILKASGGFT